MRYFWMTSALVAAFTVMGCGNDEQPQSGGASAAATGGDHSLPGDPEAGKAVYDRICVACHAADGLANGGLTAAAFVGPDSPLSKSNDVLLTSIREGRQNAGRIMPAQKDVLSEQEMKDALSYIRHHFGGTE